VESQTSDKGGLRHALSDESMDTGSISGCSQRESRTLKSAQRIDTNPPDLCTHCQEANCTCARSTSTTPRRCRTGESPDRGRAAQDPLLDLPEPPSDIYRLGVEHASLVFSWYNHAVRDAYALKAAQTCRKFAEEQYEKSLARLAAVRQSQARETQPT